MKNHIRIAAYLFLNSCQCYALHSFWIMHSRMRFFCRIMIELFCIVIDLMYRCSRSPVTPADVIKPCTRDNEHRCDCFIGIVTKVLQSSADGRSNKHTPGTSHYGKMRGFTGVGLIELRSGRCVRYCIWTCNLLLALVSLLCTCF